MPNFGLGAGQIGASCVETGVNVGDPRRYKTRDVVRVSKSKIHFVNYNVYVPGKKKKSIADQRVDLLFEKQQKAISKNGDYAIPRFTKSETLELIENDKEVGVNNSTIKEKEENHKIKPFFSKNADPDMIKQYYEQEVKEKRHLQFEEEQNEIKKKRHIGGIEAMKLEAEASILWGRNKVEQLIAKDVLENVNEDPNSLTKKYGLLKLECPHPDFNAVNEMLEYEMKKKIRIDNDNNNMEIEEEKEEEEEENKMKKKKENENEKKKMLNFNLSGKIIINNKINEISSDEIIKQKSLDNYIYEKQLSTPSNILHLTRLCKNVTIDNLISIYNRFQKDINNPIEYTLFQKGKLRNQAFIKFDSIETAKDALELSRGYILLGKPIIVDFGKSK